MEITSEDFRQGTLPGTGKTWQPKLAQALELNVTSAASCAELLLSSVQRLKSDNQGRERCVPTETLVGCFALPWAHVNVEFFVASLRYAPDEDESFSE